MNKSELQIATFGAGCFWGVEETFRQLQGVKETAVGFMGGTLENPTYEDVCTGNTNHAEVLQLKYNAVEISYEELLDIFWKNHNPTTFNRQGPDVGSQYRSIIFYHTPEQKIAAEKSKEQLQKSPRYQEKKIVTQIHPASQFYRAEEYHQRYFEKRGGESCHI